MIAGQDHPTRTGRGFSTRGRPAPKGGRSERPLCGLRGPQYPATKQAGESLGGRRGLFGHVAMSATPLRGWLFPADTSVCPVTETDGRSPTRRARGTRRTNALRVPRQGGYPGGLYSGKRGMRSRSPEPCCSQMIAARFWRPTGKAVPRRQSLSSRNLGTVAELLRHNTRGRGFNPLQFWARGLHG